MKPLLGVLLAILLLGQTVYADIYDLPKVAAVQNRKYFLNDEVTLQGTYLPLDALYKYVGVGASYTHFFSDFTGWEVVNGFYVFKQSTDLLDTIKNANFEIGNKLHVLEYFGSSNIVYTPMYTKSLLFNNSLVFGEFSLVGGVAFGKFEEGTKTGIDLGLIIRFFTGQRSSLKFDFRDYYFMGSPESINHFVLTLGFAFNLGGAPATPSEFGDE